MRNDPIVDEIRKIRQQHTEQFNRNLHAICKDLRRQELQSSHKFIAFSPRSPEANAAAALARELL